MFANIGSCNGSLFGRNQTYTRINDDLMLIGHVVMNVNEIRI